MMPQRNQEKDSNSGINLVEIWGSWIRVKKFRFLQVNFRKISIFSGNFTKEYRVLQANFRKFLFFQAIKNIDFPSKKVHLQLPLGKLFYFSSKVTAFEHTFLYMIR